MIHRYVILLDTYFGSVCELDLTFHFHKAHYLLDEVVIAGEFGESSRRQPLKACARMDALTKEGNGGKAGSYRDPEILQESLKSAGLL